jgi:hypothetical protein
MSAIRIRMLTNDYLMPLMHELTRIKSVKKLMLRTSNETMLFRLIMRNMSR